MVHSESGLSDYITYWAVDNKNNPYKVHFVRFHCESGSSLTNIYGHFEFHMSPRLPEQMDKIKFKHNIQNN